MKTDALAVANYFIELARKEAKPIYLLGLVKRVYIAHGFSLAIQDKSLLDPRFDKAEAWKYGPVIPSVYHSFKNYRTHKIEKPIENLTIDSLGEVKWVMPKLIEERDKQIVKIVWNRYKNYSDSQLVTLLHRPGTPWDVCYEPDKNNEIPDGFTKRYYEKLVKAIVERKKDSDEN